MKKVIYSSLAALAMLAGDAFGSATPTKSVEEMRGIVQEKLQAVKEQADAMPMELFQPYQRNAIKSCIAKSAFDAVLGWADRKLKGQTEFDSGAKEKALFDWKGELVNRLQVYDAAQKDLAAAIDKETPKGDEDENGRQARRSAGSVR